MAQRAELVVVAVAAFRLQPHAVASAPPSAHASTQPALPPLGAHDLPPPPSRGQRIAADEQQDIVQRVRVPSHVAFARQPAGVQAVLVRRGSDLRVDPVQRGANEDLCATTVHGRSVGGGRLTPARSSVAAHPARHALHSPRRRKTRLHPERIVGTQAQRDISVPHSTRGGERVREARARSRRLVSHETAPSPTRRSRGK